MRYRIEYDEKVYDQLSKLPRNLRNSILKAIDERLTVDPKRFKTLTTNWKDYFRMRIGDYRVIYKVEDEIVTVTIVCVAPRGNAY